MSLIVVGAGLVLTLVIRWSRAVLADETVYLRAVAPLASSPRFARLSGSCVSMAARHRGRPHIASRRVGTTLGRITTWTMGRPGFRHPWRVGHRIVHRRRCSVRVGVAMVILASMGVLFEIPGRVRSSLS